MANIWYITKISGVVRISMDSGLVQSFVNQPVSYRANANQDGVDIQIGVKNFQIPVTDLRVNGQTPANITVALVLLNSIFGT